MEQNLETSTLLSQEDYKLMNEIKVIKKHIMSYIDMSVMVEGIREIIGNSEIVSFRSARAEKFINKDRPVFSLTVDRSTCTDVYPTSQFTNSTQEAEYFTSVITGEVINEFTSFLVNSIANEENLEEFLGSHELFKGISVDNINNTVGMLSSIFAIRMDNDDMSKVALEFLT